MGVLQSESAQTSRTVVAEVQHTLQLCVGPHISDLVDSEKWVDRTWETVAMVVAMVAEIASGISGRFGVLNTWVRIEKASRRPTSV